MSPIKIWANDEDKLGPFLTLSLPSVSDIFIQERYTKRLNSMLLMGEHAIQDLGFVSPSLLHRDQKEAIKNVIFG